MRLHNTQLQACNYRKVPFTVGPIPILIYKSPFIECGFIIVAD